MQTSGVGLLLGAFLYSEGAWQDMSAGGIGVGVLSLAAPIVLAPRAMRRGVVMPAVHLATGLGFLAVFLDRATPLSADGIVWVLDGVLIASMLVLVRMLVTDRTGERHPWALNAFVMAMLAGFALVAATAVGPLDLSDDAVWPLDAWLGLAVILAVWGVHRGPVGLSRGWLGRVLAWLLCVWMAFGFFTALEALDGPPELPLLLVGGAGVEPDGGGLARVHRAALVLGGGAGWRARRGRGSGGHGRPPLLAIRPPWGRRPGRPRIALHSTRTRGAEVPCCRST
jgi:hypothetical protein